MQRMKSYPTRVLLILKLLKCSQIYHEYKDSAAVNEKKITEKLLNYNNNYCVFLCYKKYIQN